ncbi:MAG: Ig-like domain-containing protein [Gemmatimonadota bacterium]
MSTNPVRAGALAVALLLTVGACEELTVTTMPVASVEISPGSLTLVQGDQGTVSATPRGSAGIALSGRAVTWSSDDPSVAAVDASGRVEALEPGNTSIRAESEGVSSSIEVSVLSGRSIVLGAESVGLEGVAGGPSTQVAEVPVENGGSGTLDHLSVTVVEAEGPEGWLGVALASATAPTTLQVQGDPGELEVGTYRARLSIAAPRALNSPVELEVIFEVAEPAPVIVVSPTSLSLSAPQGSLTPATQTVDVVNGGGGTLDELEVEISYSGSGSGGWLQADLEDDGAPTELMIEASARFLAPGVYTAVVAVSSPDTANEAAEVTVTFRVQERFGGSDSRAPGAQR